MLDAQQRSRLDEIERRLNLVSSGPWRNTIRRETPQQVAASIQNVGGIGRPCCSEVVVNTSGTPKAENVVCWMGPAAGEQGDDLMDAQFIAHARDDLQYLCNLIRFL